VKNDPNNLPLDIKKTEEQLLRLTVQNNIKEFRISKNFSQKHIAITLNVSQPTVSDWESGRKFPSIFHLLKLANLFECSLHKLLGIDDALVKSGSPPVNYMREQIRRYLNLCNMDELKEVYDYCQYILYFRHNKG